MDWQKLLVVSASLKTGLLQSIASRAQSAEELAIENNYNLRAVEFVMEALVELGLAINNGGHYETTKLAAAFVDKDNPDYKANALLHTARLVQNWTNLDQAIITGKSQTRRRSPEELEIFVRSMDEYSKHYAAEVASLLLNENKSAKNALDLGGALGTFSKPLADNGLEVTLIDTEAVAALSKKYLSHPSINILAGDFTQELPEGPFDIILMSNITHIYKPDKLIALFNRAKEKLTNKGLIGIVDFVRGKSNNAAMFGVNMLVHTAGGGTWSLSQYETWLRQAGLALKSFKDLKCADQKLLIVEKV